MASEEELDVKYKIDIVQEAPVGANEEMIIIYNYDGAELTPEMLAKTLEELSTQTSLNRPSTSERLLVDESGKIIQDTTDFGQENQIFVDESIVGNSVLLPDGWEQTSPKLEVIALDSTSASMFPSSYCGSNSTNSGEQSVLVSEVVSDVNNIKNDEMLSTNSNHPVSNPETSENSSSLTVCCSTQDDEKYRPNIHQNEENLAFSIKPEDAEAIDSEVCKIEYACEECDFVSLVEIEFQRHQKTVHNVQKPFVCCYCSQAFKLELSLDIHKFSHTTNSGSHNSMQHIHKVLKFFSCPLCDFQYQKKAQLIKHMLKMHEGEKYLFCNECNFSCLSEEEKESHMASTSHKEEKLTLCPLCGASTKSLRQHLRVTHNENRPYACDKCSFRAKTVANLKSHMATHEGLKQVSCPQCSYRCRTKDQLKKHMIRHTSEKKFACQVCSFSCKTALSLKRHMQIHQAPDKYVCKICNFKTHDKHILKEHKQNLHKLKPRHVCRECGCEFERPLELRKHALSVHKSDKTQFCAYCDFSCSTTSELRTHLEVHFGKNSYVCAICGYSSRIKASYRRHMSRHNKVKNFKCQFCNYACVEKYDLQKHIAHRHSEEKPFSCPYCPYTCKFKPRLNNHISFVHSDEKPFFCNQCSYAGKSAESLKKHMVHHGVLPESFKSFQCVLCDYFTHDRAKVRRHMKVHVNNFLHRNSVQPVESIS